MVVGSRFLFVIILLFCLTVSLSANAIDEVYRLDAGDVIDVSVWGHEELRTRATVGPDGLISLPMLGEVSLRGCTLAEARQLLMAKMAKFIREPEITVILAARRQISVKVFGEVKNPGAFLVYPNASIAELIAMAGGPTDRAALEQVQLLKAGDPNTIEIVPQGKNDKFGMGAAVRGPRLDDGDVIFVPETKQIDWERVFFFLGGLLTLKELLLE